MAWIALKKILLIDDDRSFIRLLAQLLEKRCEIYIANGIKEAKTLLSQTQVDAICSDYKMQDGTGLGLLKELRKNGDNTPFMLMSADYEYYLKVEAKNLSASFCAKLSPDFSEQIIFWLQNDTRLKKS